MRWCGVMWCGDFDVLSLNVVVVVVVDCLMGRC